MKDVVAMMDAYTRWADARLLAAIPADAWLKEVGGSFGSLRNTAVHLVSAQGLWLSRWKGGPPAGMWKPEEVADLDTLRARAEATSRERREFLEAQTEASLAAELRYTTTEGKSYANPLGELVLHMANHSTYHRGQLAAFLRNLGVKPPPTDFVAWMRSGKP